MPLPIVMGSPRAKELQDAIQTELAVKGWAPANDPVMAEFITIMLINSKTPEQITTELKELIGDDYESEFTTWLFVEAGMGDENAAGEDFADEEDPTLIVSRTTPTGPRSSMPLLSQALSSLSPPKRTRSPSTSDSAPPRKAPRMSDLPDRPRAMRDESQPIPVVGSPQNQSRPSGRSLLDRMGPAPRYPPQQQQHPNFRQGPVFDPIQAQIEAVTASMGMGGFMPPMMTMDQMQMQELMQSQAMMLNQMSQFMQQFQAAGASVNGSTPSAAFTENAATQNGGNGHAFGPGGRGRSRGAPNRGTGRGVIDPNLSRLDQALPSQTAAPVIAIPKPVAAEENLAPAFTYPDRPGTPTLCKFGMTCSNPVCRYSHPSPAASVESGLVLSNDPCENGIKCDNKDCTKAHPSRAQLDPNAVIPAPAAPARPAYAKPAYHPYTKPSPATPASFNIACKFGAGCTRATCPYQHPTGRTTLPGEFHRGLKISDPTVKLASGVQDKARTLGAASANRFNKSVTFNKPRPAASGGSSQKESNNTPLTEQKTPSEISSGVSPVASATKTIAAA